MPEEEPRDPRDGDHGLTWLLVVVMLANGALVLYAAVARHALLDALPGLTTGDLAVLVAVGSVGAVSAVGAIRRRRWGVVGVVLGMAGLFVVGLKAGAPVEHTLVGPVGILLVVMYARPAWRRMR